MLNEALARKCAEAIQRLKKARTAWHMMNGVPISEEYANFLQAIGDVTDVAAAILSYAEQAEGWVSKLQDREWVGRIMHESWSRTKREQGFHGPNEDCIACMPPFGGKALRKDWIRCDMFHADLIPWEQLPESEKDINRHALADVLKALALPAPPQEKA